MEIIHKIWGYINIFQKKDPNAETSINLKLMHGMNRISVFMFIICVIVLIVRFFTK